MKVYTLFRVIGLLAAASLLTACGTAKLTTAVEATEAIEKPQTQRTVIELDTVNIQLNNTFTDADGKFTYTIESNSEPSVVTPSITGNNLNFVFSNLGTSIITFRETDANGSRLASLTVDITDGGSSKPADVKFTVGSNFLADTSAGFSYNNLQNSNPSVVLASISGDSMTLDFRSEGTSNISFDEIDPKNVVRPASFTITGISCNEPIVAFSNASATISRTLTSVCTVPSDN